MVMLDTGSQTAINTTAAPATPDTNNPATAAPAHARRKPRGSGYARRKHRAF